MSDPSVWIHALRGSHNRFAALVQPLDDATIQELSYATEWSIAQVASHLGSQAEIFALFLDAGLSGQDAPGAERFQPIWNEWNNREPRRQVVDSLRANEDLVAGLERLADAERAAFALDMFGSVLDLTGLCQLRLGEHALHTWDVAVALDPDAQVSNDAVALLIDTLPAMASRIGKPSEPGREIVIETTAPRRGFVLKTGPDVELAAAAEIGPVDIRIPAEALVRLLYGRLDPDHTPSGISGVAALAYIRPVFPGF